MTARNLACIACIALISAGGITAQETIHVLKKGETLYSLARTYGVSYSALVEANKITDANKMKAGQKILIPSSVTSPAPASVPAVSNAAVKHTVAKGETLYSISRRYDLTVSELRAFNNFTDKSVLKTGDVLLVRQLKPASAAPAADRVPDSVVAVSKPESGKSDPTPTKGDELRPVTAKKNDASVKWPVHAKELAYIEGKLYGVLLVGERAERVESLSAGTVVSADTYRGYGRVAIVQSPDGHVYVYGGNESLSVKAGDRIASGAELGRLGIDSLTGKPALFFFVYKDNVAIDPAKAPRS